jgi:hypothetical protein
MIKSLDIIHNVLSFNSQIPERQKLLEDIKDFYKSRQILYYIYEYDYNNDMKDWLLNDLYRFYNNDVPTMHGFVNKFYKLLSRHYMLDTNEKITKLLNKSLANIGNSQSKQINYFLGLLTPTERLNFIIERYTD